MSYHISDTTITLTRGDTLKAYVNVTDSEGNKYIPDQGDRIRFAMKKKTADSEPLVLKEIPTNTMLLVLDPEDTKSLDFGNYVYDIELTKANGEVYTFITVSKFNISEEVH